MTLAGGRGHCTGPKDVVGQAAVILASLISGPGALWSLEGGWWPGLQAAWSLAMIESWRG